jgi:hypothetical protein
MLRQDGQAPIVLGAAGGCDPIDDLFLEHQGHRCDVIRLMQPANEQGGRDIVGEIGNNAPRRRAEARHIDLQCIGLMHSQAAGGRLLQIVQRGDRPPVDFDCDESRRAFEQKGARETTRTGSDLDHRALVEWARRAGDPSRQVEVEEEVLAQPLAGVQSMSGDGLTQRRQPRNGVIHRQV